MSSMPFDPTQALAGAAQSAPAPAPASGGGGGGGVPGQPDNPDADQALSDAIDAINRFLSAEQDDQDKTIAAKSLAALQGIKGTRQKQDESALGITPAHKAMSRAYQRGGSGGGY